MGETVSEAHDVPEETEHGEVNDSRILPLSEARALFDTFYIAAALEATEHNRTAAARILGVDSRTMFRLTKAIRESDRAADPLAWREVVELANAGADWWARQASPESSF